MQYKRVALDTETSLVLIKQYYHSYRGKILWNGHVTRQATYPMAAVNKLSMITVAQQE